MIGKLDNIPCNFTAIFPRSEGGSFVFINRANDGDRNTILYDREGLACFLGLIE
jgi:hypothetical protein